MKRIYIYFTVVVVVVGKEEKSFDTYIIFPISLTHEYEYKKIALCI